MSNSSTNPSNSPNANADGGRARRLMVRGVVTGVVLVLTVGALLIGTRWIRYRWRNVVVGEATVKGTVAKIGTRIEGRVKSIEVEVGQHVTKGQVLFRLDDSHFLAELAHARAMLKSATSDFDSEKLAIEQSRRRLNIEIKRVTTLVEGAKAQVEKEQSNLERLESQYTRTEGLLTNGAVSRVDFEVAKNNRDQSRAQILFLNAQRDTADSLLEKAMNDLEGLSVREFKLKGALTWAIDAAKAQVAGAEANLEASVNRAPDDGRVLERIVEVGGSAKVGEPMLSLWLGHAWMEAWVDERDLRKFKIGSPAEVCLDRAPDRKLAGRVEAIGLESDKQMQPLPVPPTLHSFLRLNSMVPVRIALDEDNSKLQLGLSAMVGIQKESAEPDVNGSRVEEIGKARISQANP